MMQYEYYAQYHDSRYHKLNNPGNNGCNQIPRDFECLGFLFP